jgi:4-hydroxymandelate oxidase
MLVDVTHVDKAACVLGTPISLPIMLAPTAFNRLAHPDGETAAARAAGDAGTIMVVSTLATSSLEQISAASTGPLWFQLYVYRDRSVTIDLVQRAEALGYRALVLTVDAPRLGRRERDTRNRFVLPAGMTISNLEKHYAANAARWDEDLGFFGYIASLFDPSLTWEAVEWLRSVTRLPLLLKGILTPEDAQRAADLGVAGIVVSNHGGRQLDGVDASITALGPIADRVNGRAEILMDGGIRRGTDVLKALALGARAVLIGRAYLWGLAAEGEPGVRRVLEILGDELELAMALSGRPTIGAVDRSLISP